MFGSRQQLSKCPTKDININEDIIEPVPVIRYLGAWLDQQLKLNVHISKKCQTAMINLEKIRLIKHFLTREATEILVLRLVLRLKQHTVLCNKPRAVKNAEDTEHVCETSSPKGKV